MGTRGRELITTDEPTVVTEPFLDAIIVEDGENNRRLSNSARTNESNRCEVSGESNDLLNQFVASETGPRWRGRHLTKYTRCKCEAVDPITIEVADLV